MCLPDVDAKDAQWGDGFEVETLINVRVAAGRLKVTEVCSYESDRIYGVSNLNALTDGFRVLRTIRQEFLQKHATRHHLRSGVASLRAPEITARYGPRSADNVVSRAHKETISDKSCNVDLPGVAREIDVTA
jgi:hypothetical protein